MQIVVFALNDLKWIHNLLFFCKFANVECNLAQNSIENNPREGRRNL